MATRTSRSALTRVLPFLLAMMLAWVAAPQAPVMPAAASHSPAAVASAAPAGTVSLDSPAAGPEASAAPTEIRDVASAVADRAAVLSAQRTAAVRGSRAPPAALA